MIELVIGNEDGTIDNASIPIRWCVDNETVDRLRELKNLYVMIQVKYDTIPYKTERFFYKLNTFMNYIPFRKAGEVIIEAYIIGITHNRYSVKYCINEYINRKEWGDYVYTINLTQEKTNEVITNNDVKICEIQIHDTVESKYRINIPKNVFGKELPSLAKFMVNRYLDNKKSVDECHTRRRILSFIFFRSFLFIPEFIIRLLIRMMLWLFLFALGCYKTTFEYILHPFKVYTIYDFNDSLEEWQVLDVFYKKLYSLDSKNALSPHHTKMIGLITTLLAPAIPLVSMIYWAIIHYSFNIDTLYAILYIPLAHISVLGLIICGIICFSILKQILELLVNMLLGIKVTNKWSSVYKWVVDKYENGYIKLINTLERFGKIFLNDDNLKKELLTCNGDANNITTNIKHIPLKSRSIDLIYMNIKNKICKPMQE